MMMMIIKTARSQVDFPVAEGKRRTVWGRGMRNLQKDTWLCALTKVKKTRMK